MVPVLSSVDTDEDSIDGHISSLNCDFYDDASVVQQKWSELILTLLNWYSTMHLMYIP